MHDHRKDADDVAAKHNEQGPDKVRLLSMGVRFLEHLRSTPHHEHEVCEQHPEEDRRREPPSKTGPHAYEDEDKHADEGPHQVHSRPVRSRGIRRNRHLDGSRRWSLTDHVFRQKRADLGLLANGAQSASSGQVQLNREERFLEPDLQVGFHRERYFCDVFRISFYG